MLEKTVHWHTVQDIVLVLLQHLLDLSVQVWHCKCLYKCAATGMAAASRCTQVSHAHRKFSTPLPDKNYSRAPHFENRFFGCYSGSRVDEPLLWAAGSSSEATVVPTFAFESPANLQYDRSNALTRRFLFMFSLFMALCTFQHRLSNQHKQ